MKRLFFLFGLSAISFGTFAQQDVQHQHTGNKYGVTVFANSHNLRPAKRADIGLNTKLAAKFPGWYIATDPWTGGFKDLNGSPIAVSGKTLSEKANNLMMNQLSVAGIKAGEWKLDHQFTNSKGYTYLYFYQAVDGKKVTFAKMHFRFTPDGKVARINMKGFGSPDASLTPVISEAKALDIATQELDGAIVTAKSIETNMEWFPIPTPNGFILHPAYKFLVEGKVQESSSIPLNMFGFVDAIDGTLLYRDNETKDATDIKIVGSIYTDGYLNPTKIVGLPYVTAKIGTSTTLLANDTGFITTSAFTLPTTATISLEGPWSKVRSVPDANATPSFSKSITALGTSDSFNTASKSSSRHINAYYHVNTVHDFMKSLYGTSFTGMDYSLNTNVDASGTCNAFYTSAGSSSINFYPAGGGCVSFAEIRDVVYHEYGHAIVSKMYSGGMKNGALNEGQADIWGMSITKNAILAQGSNGTASSFIRRYDIDPKVYPMDLIGEVHADGEIIAGAWWDYGINVGSTDSMAKLFAECLLNDKPDGANGTEGEVYFEMLMSALMNDDDDAILSNGTPHFSEIVKAFAKHGIYLLQDIEIGHNELAHQAAGKPIDVTANLTISNPYFFQSLNLVYRVRGAAWDTIKMVDAGGFSFNAQIPAQPEGIIIDYYFSAQDLLDNEGIFAPANYFPSVILPENKVTLPYQFAVGVSKMRMVDFESTLDPDWQIGVSTVDAATAGKWVQAVPIATYSGSLIVQTGNDHTSASGKCLVTGNITGTATTQSVKNGLTSVRTPFYDLTGYTNPIVEYYRWYSNDRGYFPKKEIWKVQMSAGSEIFTKDVENTNQSDHQWRRKIFKPLDLISTAKQMQLRFLATETPTVIAGAGSFNGLVEAGVDDLVIYEGKEGVVSSIAEMKQELAKIYPNPAIDVLNVILPSASFENISIAFYDIAGKLISTVPVTKGAAKYSIDTKAMTSGQYLLVIQMDKTIQTHKVTIVAE
jgi:hypothetical protein